MHKHFNDLANHIKVKSYDDDPRYSYQSLAFKLSYEDFTMVCYLECDENELYSFTLFEGLLKSKYIKSYNNTTLNNLLKKYSDFLNIDYNIDMHGFYTHSWTFISNYEIHKESIYFAFWYLFYTSIIMSQIDGSFENLSNKTKEMFLKLIHLENKILVELPEEYLTKNHA